jgi:hypothetical protein
MNLSSVVGSFGSSVIDVIAERLSGGTVAVCNAYIRPVDCPASDRIDVTKQFCSLMREKMMLVAHVLPIQTLTKRKLISGSEWWLCVVFVLTGGSRNMAVYKLPHETVTFPPILTTTKIPPLSSQIVSANVMVSDEDALDMSTQMTELLGPNGDCFGRLDGIDIKLALSFVMDALPDKAIWSYKIVAAALTGFDVFITINTADGAEHKVQGATWKP